MSSGLFHRTGMGVAALAVLMVLSGCPSTPINHAPVVDRSSGAVTSNTKASSADAATKAPAGSENAGKPGYYTVKAGDTLSRIGSDNGQSPKDIARWNALENPDKIEIGQVLRVQPPTGSSTATTKPVTSGNVTTAAIPATTGASAPAAPAAAAGTAGSANNASNSTAGSAAASDSEEEVSWQWPAKGAVLKEFDEAKNRGIDIAGSAGDAVYAAADGKVVWVGTNTGLRNYGNLVIIKHNNVFITAYAHNQAILVKDDQIVKKGQKIAEMGNTGDTDRVKLHFELRRQSKPVDPQKYLPKK